MNTFKTMNVCRFAPSTTGHGHLGTLLAALLAYLDARADDSRFILRFEDLDPQRCLPEFTDSMRAMLEWMSIEWDSCESQSDHLSAYEAALDDLAAQGRIYACSCSRAQLKDAAPALDGGRIYPGTCRRHVLTHNTWRDCTEAIRLRLPDAFIEIEDLGGCSLSQNPLTAMGDPVIRRRDRAYAYHLVAVVDDAAQQVTRIVRGHDIASSTAIHCVLQDALGYQRPQYRHHLLFLEQRDRKLAKLHQSIPWMDIREQYNPDALRGLLAEACALTTDGSPLSMSALQNIFSWDSVGHDDVLMASVEGQLRWSVP